MLITEPVNILSHNLSTSSHTNLGYLCTAIQKRTLCKTITTTHNKSSPGIRQ